MAEYIERTEEIMLAMNAGARAIENTKRYHCAVYTKDLFSDNSQKIPYLQAAKVLREVSDAPAADVAPVVHGVWVCVNKADPISGYRYSKCRHIVGFDLTPYCPNCGARMDGKDGGDSNEADLRGQRPESVCC